MTPCTVTGQITTHKQPISAPCDLTSADQIVSQMNQLAAPLLGGFRAVEIQASDQYAGAAPGKAIVETKERVDAELAEILGGASVKKQRKSQTCSEEHSARTCPQKPPTATL